MNAKAMTKPGAAAPQTKVDFDALIALIDELIVVIDGENEALARGLPASLSTSIPRKNALADQLEQWTAHIKERRLQILPHDRELRARMLQRTRSLRERMAENVSRLQAAMDASRHRVEAVMRAIREQAAADATYGASGRAAPPPVLNGSMSRQV